MKATELIRQERCRQEGPSEFGGEDYTADHDDQWKNGELALAAACYAIPEGCSVDPWPWPWDERFWKPSPNDRIRELVKAGALIVAEIDRLQRLNDSTAR